MRLRVYQEYDKVVDSGQPPRCCPLPVTCTLVSLPDLDLS